MPTDRDVPRSSDSPALSGASRVGARHSGPVRATPNDDALPPLDALCAAFDSLIRSGALAADAPPPSLARSEALRAAVSADVQALRSRGLLPEAVVIAVKARAREALRLAAAASPPTATDLAASLTGDRRRRSDEWIACAVTYCIDEYFAQGKEGE
ncbi:MAG TPA: hypothetical protein VFJ74_16810 [Gemmatimonadaceae bacterium]|nr:hypothetical protein [Gemmatimonadaceae bacterium]